MSLSFVCLVWVSLFSSSYATKFQKEEALHIKEDPHFNGTIFIGAPISFDMNDIYYNSAVQMKQSWGMFTEWVNNRGGIRFNGRNVSIEVICMEDYSDSYYVQEAMSHFLTADPPIDFFLAPLSR